MKAVHPTLRCTICNAKLVRCSSDYKNWWICATKRPHYSIHLLGHNPTYTHAECYYFEQFDVTVDHDDKTTKFFSKTNNAIKEVNSALTKEQILRFHRAWFLE